MPALRHGKADREDELVAKRAVIHAACSGFVLTRERQKPPVLKAGSGSGSGNERVRMHASIAPDWRARSDSVPNAYQPSGREQGFRSTTKGVRAVGHLGDSARRGCKPYRDCRTELQDLRFPAGHATVVAVPSARLPQPNFSAGFRPSSEIRRTSSWLRCSSSILKRWMARPHAACCVAPLRPPLIEQVLHVRLVLGPNPSHALLVAVGVVEDDWPVKPQGLAQRGRQRPRECRYPSALACVGRCLLGCVMLVQAISTRLGSGWTGSVRTG